MKLRIKGIYFLVGIMGILFVRQAYAVPIASFTADPNPVEINELITFDASASFDTDPNRQIVEYEWDFQNDGNFDILTNEPTVEFAYDNLGVFTALLRIVNDESPAQIAVDTEGIVVEGSAQVPEPSTMLLLGIGLAGLVGVASRRRQKEVTILN